MIEMAELIDKDFKAVIIQIFQQAIMNMLETMKNQKVPAKKSLTKEIENIKKKLNRNSMTKPYNKNSQWMGSTAEWRGQRKELVN